MPDIRLVRVDFRLMHGQVVTASGREGGYPFCGEGSSGVPEGGIRK